MMMGKQAVWVDGTRCTGCGMCVQVCPVEAIALADGRAMVDEVTCTGCGTCVVICPQGAIQPVIQGELVSASERPVPAVSCPSPLMRTTGTAAAVAGTGLLIGIARGLVRAVDRWLRRRSAAAERSTGVAPGAQSHAAGGRWTRHRWRGG